MRLGDSSASLGSKVDQIDLFDSSSGMSQRSLIVEHQHGNHGNERRRVAILSSSHPILDRTTLPLWVSCLMQSKIQSTLVQFPLQEVQMVRGTTPCYHASAPRRLECGLPIHTHAHTPPSQFYVGKSDVGWAASLHLLHPHLANDWGQAILFILTISWAS